MKISAVYVDSNGNEFPVKVCGCRCSSAEELMINFDLAGIALNDTIKVRIINDNAVLDKGDPVEDANDITYAHSDENGNVMLSGNGG